VPLGKVTCVITCPRGHVALRSRDRAPLSAAKGEESAASALPHDHHSHDWCQKISVPEAHALVFRTRTTVLKVRKRARARRELMAR
jgi:hypothetical protein